MYTLSYFSSDFDTCIRPVLWGYAYYLINKIYCLYIKKMCRKRFFLCCLFFSFVFLVLSVLICYFALSFWLSYCHSQYSELMEFLRAWSLLMFFSQAICKHGNLKAHLSL